MDATMQQPSQPLAVKTSQAVAAGFSALLSNLSLSVSLKHFLDPAEPPARLHEAGNINGVRLRPRGHKHRAQHSLAGAMRRTFRNRQRLFPFASLYGCIYRYLPWLGRWYRNAWSSEAVYRED